jgi:hypothetical protein
MSNATYLIVWGTVAHLVCDWLFQNDWMARNKSNLKHPAAYAHGFIHLIGMSFVFHLPIALVLAMSHILIDTRKPLTWWRRVFQQTTEGPAAMHVAMWSDQVLHISLIAIAAYIVTL